MSILNNRPKARLVLENGTVFHGYGFGTTQNDAEGEVVFNTSMTGYQEILTDPSYYGQIITFTYPHQGNVGVNEFDVESCGVQAAGMIIKELARLRSNWRSNMSLEDYLTQSGTIGIEGIDTRMLVRILRTEGAMRGIITTSSETDEELIQRARGIDEMIGLDLTTKVTTDHVYEFEPLDKSGYLLETLRDMSAEESYHVVVIDFGVKRNILERLAAYGCRLTVVPSTTSADDILAYDPDGIFVSNGPGDPFAVTKGIETLKGLIGKKPIFGICLGHQLLALALGGTTYKLKFGHRGANHPVQQVGNSANEITSQNHGFAVDLESMSDLPVELTHINLNDRTVEGFRHRDYPLFCVQYHPEAGPGPHDADYLFDQFIDLMETERNRSGKVESGVASETSK